MGFVAVIVFFVVIAVVGGLGYWVYILKRKKDSEKAAATPAQNTDGSLQIGGGSQTPPDTVNKTDETITVHLVRHIKDNTCLDGDGKSLYLLPCQQGNEYQQWVAKDKLVKHRKSGRCLDSNGKGVYFGDCGSENPYQQWELSEHLLKHTKDDTCLDGDGKSVYANKCATENPFMQWEFA